ncbi:MAG TPA: MFS transporter [Candidatus Limnocylindria bacterium]|nr:MFS transporter [Candidatus Limnocylindria bacterium]
MTSSHEKSEPPIRHRWWSLAVASLATLIVTVDTGQLSIALPRIIKEFDADLALASWIALVYAFITASLYLPCGRLSDLFGIGKLFLAGFLLYSASSLAAGLAQGSGQLIFFRALQAAGSALIMANNFALITALFPPAERGRAMGIAGGTISALGYTLGPVLGGLITHAFGWRANFYLSGALALFGFGAARTLLPRESFHGAAASKEPFDFAGMISFGLSISLLLFAMALAQKGEWQSPFVVIAALAGSAALAYFIWWEKRARYPLLDLGLFRIPAFTFGNSARLISFIAMSVSILLMPFFIQLAMGLDPLAAGFLVAPTPLAMALLAPLTGWLSEKFLPERLCALGMGVTGAAFVYLSFLAAGAAPAQVIFGLALLGVGMGIFQTPNNNLLMSSVPRHRLGVGSSVLSIVRSLGYSIGAALAAAIVSARLVSATGQTSLEFFRGPAAGEVQSVALSAFLSGFQIACLVAAVICFIGAAISAVRVSRD